MARIISLLAIVFLCSMASGEQLDFARDIRPVLSDACYHCHGPDAKVRKAKLRLHDRAAALETSVLTNGEMLRRLTSDDPDERMPPVDSNRPLRDADRAKLVEWLQAGAAWPSDDGWHHHSVNLLEPHRRPTVACRPCFFA